MKEILQSVNPAAKLLGAGVFARHALDGDAVDAAYLARRYASAAYASSCSIISKPNAPIVHAGMNTQ